MPLTVMRKRIPYLIKLDFKRLKTSISTPDAVTTWVTYTLEASSVQTLAISSAMFIFYQVPHGQLIKYEHEGIFQEFQENVLNI